MIVTFDQIDQLIIDSDGKLRAKIKAELCKPKGESHYYMIVGIVDDIVEEISFVILTLTDHL